MPGQTALKWLTFPHEKHEACLSGQLEKRCTIPQREQLLLMFDFTWHSGDVGWLVLKFWGWNWHGDGDRGRGDAVLKRTWRLGPLLLLSETGLTCSLSSLDDSCWKAALWRACRALLFLISSSTCDRTGFEVATAASAIHAACVRSSNDVGWACKTCVRSSGFKPPSMACCRCFGVCLEHV